MIGGPGHLDSQESLDTVGPNLPPTSAPRQSGHRSEMFPGREHKHLIVLRTQWWPEAALDLSPGDPATPPPTGSRSTNAAMTGQGTVKIKPSSKSKLVIEHCAKLPPGTKGRNGGLC